METSCLHIKFEPLSAKIITDGRAVMVGSGFIYILFYLRFIEHESLKEKAPVGTCSEYCVYQII